MWLYRAPRQPEVHLDLDGALDWYGSPYPVWQLCGDCEGQGGQFQQMERMVWPQCMDILRWHVNSRS